MSGPIRRLNERGRAAFRAWLDGGARDAPPLELLDDPAYSNPVHPALPRPTEVYERRYDLGLDLVDLLDALELSELRFDAGLWDWLSLLLIDQLCPPDEAGRRRPKQIDRYLLQLDNYRTRYRHLVRSAWSLVRVHGSTARFMLAGPLHVHGEASEQIGSRQDVITCKPLIRTIASLVWDEEKAGVKRGFRGDRPGSARRVPIIARQLRLTFDLDSMQPEQILALLPREFDRFRSQPPQSQARRASRSEWSQHERRLGTSEN